MKHDDFGDRMKSYEHAPLKDKYDGHLPLYIRLDGRSFSKLTKSLRLRKPRDGNFVACFETAIKKTMQEFNLSFAFHQSDEISFYFPLIEEGSTAQLPFDGKTYKLLSVIPSYFTCLFSTYIKGMFGEDKAISFDARIVEFPTTVEATNMLVWRYQDAKRNYISDLVSTVRSPKQLFGMSTEERYEIVKDLYHPDEIADFYVKELVDYGDYQRHRIEKKHIAFDELSFEERMGLIY